MKQGKWIVIQLLWIFFALGLAFSSVANTVSPGGKDQFFAQVLPFYKAQLKNIHAKNLVHLQKGEYDSLTTTIEIDFANVKYNERNESWVMPGSGDGGSGLTVEKNKFAYVYNFLTGESRAEETFSAGDSMWVHNTKQLALSPAEINKGIVIYCITIHNLPLFVTNKPFEEAAIDTTKSFYENLKAMRYTDDDMLRDLLCENNAIGRSMAQSIEEFQDQAVKRFVVLFNSYSEPIPVRGKNKSFRFYNFYTNTADATTDLSGTLRATLETFKHNSAVQTGDILSAFAATIQCSEFSQCDGVASLFKTPEAKSFWVEFIDTCNNRGGSFFADHKLRAIEIGTAIDNYADRQLAVLLREKALCYVDEAICEQKRFVNHVNAIGASYLTWYYLHVLGVNPSVTVLNEQEVRSQIQNGNTKIKFRIQVDDGDDNLTEMEFEFSDQQTKEEMKVCMAQLGFEFSEHYFYWLYCTDREDTWKNWGYWLDFNYNKTPPTALVIFARIIAAPGLAIYGFIEHKDAFTGEDLSGWDYALNVLDVIPAAGIFGEIGSGFFKSIKVTTKTGKIRFINSINVQVMRAYQTAFEAVQFVSAGAKKFTMRCLDWGVKATYAAADKCLLVLNKAGETIAKVFKDKIELMGDKLFPPNIGAVVAGADGQVYKLDDVDVYINGEKQVGKYELVKEGESVGVRVVGGLEDVVRGVSRNDFIASIKEFETDAQLAEDAWNLFKREKWSDLENLVNAKGLNGGWPPNAGFIDVELVNLEVGFEFDRYGGKYIDGQFFDNGGFVSPKGASFESRALPENYQASMPFKKYRIIKTISDVKKGKSIPWFSQEGLGIQFQFPFSQGIDYLKQNGYIIEI